MGLDGEEEGKMDSGWVATAKPIMITFETALHSHCGNERLGGSERILTDVLNVQAKRVDYWYTGDPESKMTI